MRNAEIFSGLTEQEYSAAMNTINAGTFTYAKNELILTAGDVTDKIGLVLSGSVIIESSDIQGNSTLLNLLCRGELFAESYALIREPLLVDVRANEDSRILFLLADNLPHNLLCIIARKNFHLSQRINTRWHERYINPVQPTAL